MDKKYFLPSDAEYINTESSIQDVKIIIEKFALQKKENETNQTKKQPEYRSLSAEKPKNTWLKFDIKNSTTAPIELFFVGGDATIPWLQVNVIKNNAIILQQTSGRKITTQDTTINHRLFLVPIHLQEAETLTLIVGTHGNNATKNLWIESQKLFISNEILTILTDGIYLGTILLIGIMSALLYISDRDRLYLYIYTIIIGSTIYHFTRNGYAHLYWWQTEPGNNADLAFISLILSIIGGVLFTMHFLTLKAQKYKWPFIVSIIQLVIIFCIITFNFIYKESITPLLTTIAKNVTGIYFVLIWSHSARRSFSKDLRARAYSIVWLFYLAPSLISIFSTQIDIQNELSTMLLARNGDVFLVLALWAALILDVRNTHLEKNAAIVESKAKSAFMATMSHELRTPLNGVIGMGELLHQTKQTALQRQYSDIIVSSGNVLLNLINDILDLTKINDRRLKFENKSFQIDKMLPECTSSFIPEMVKQNTPIHLKMSSDTPYTLIGDQYRLRQVLFNLLSNAMKFTENGIVNVTVSSNKTSSPQFIELKLIVMDTGIGIEKKAQKYIFDQFSQADRSTTRRYGGTGLGLSITRAIVEQMNGSIAVNSVVHEGATFTVNIPIEVDLEAEARRKVSLTILTGKHVLAITDVPHVFDNTIHHIKNWGMKIDIVNGINEAIGKLVDNENQHPTHYDIVIAYFMNETQKNLYSLRSLKAPLIIFHHNALDTDHIAWSKKTWMLPTPVSLGKLSNTFQEAFSQDYSNCISAITDNTVNLKGIKSVLVVEDNMTNQLVVKGMLKHLGITPDIANNGQEAVDLATLNNYDVILMDCEMPVMDGFKASTLIMKIERKNKPYIAALTAHTHNQTEIKCYKAGMQKILHKPITISALKTFFDTMPQTSKTFSQII